MSPVQVASALAARRTVRITYHRDTDFFQVTVRQGDQQLEWITSALPGKGWDLERVEAYIERQAASAARSRGLDVSRVDVP
jgi:hypothetical protein